MRSLSCLAVVVAALASFACGTAPEANEGSTHEFSLEGVDGLTRVTVDTETGSCTVDNVRFGRCTLTSRPAVDIISGHTLQVCDLETDNGSMHTFECDDAASNAAAAVDRYRERVAHCPEGG
jgi:hypothetical protein